jgi:cytoskeletal protein CcmA (bactofilin family)
VCLFTVCLSAGIALQAAAADTRVQHLGRDTFVGGDSVVLHTRVPGDAIVGGGRVLIDAPVGGDAVAAGGDVEVRGSVGDDLYVAGGQVRVAGTVAGSARLAGGEIRVLPDAKVAQGMSAAGGRIALEGAVAGYAQLAAGSIVIDGRVDGPVEAAGGELRIGPRAVILGGLTYRGPQPAQIADGARISGPMRYVHYERPPWMQIGLAALGVLAFLWLLGWALVGALLIALFPVATRDVTVEARSRPLLALGLGFAVFALAPPLVALLFATLIGIPLALAVLAVYVTLLPLGYLAGVAGVSDAFAHRRAAAATAGRRVALFVVTLIGVMLASAIPFVGWLAVLLLWLTGIGAVVLRGWEAWQPAPSPRVGVL